MENNKFKLVKNRTCYYLNNIIRLEDFDIDNILMDEKSHTNTLISDISYKTLTGSEIKFHSYHSLPIEKTMTLHNAIIIIKSVLNKDKYHYYYNMFLEKCSYQLATK